MRQQDKNFDSEAKRQLRVSRSRKGRRTYHLSTADEVDAIRLGSRAYDEIPACRVHLMQSQTDVA